MLALLIVGACDSQQATRNDQVVLDGTSVSVPLPQRLRTASDIDPAALQAIVTINGVETELQLGSDGRFSGQITVSAQSDINVQIDFMELFSGQLLTLARAEKSVTTTTGDTSLLLQQEDYVFNSFDFDGDEVSNIVERQFNTSPLDPTQSPDLVDVEIFAELPAEFVAAGFDNYQLVTSVADETFAVAASAGQFMQSVTIVRQENFSVTIHLVEGVTGERHIVGEKSRSISDSLNDSQDSASVVFDGVNWTLDSFDQDNDGVSDYIELIAGTDILSAPAANRIPFTITFDVPVEILNIESVSAELEVDGVNVQLSRLGNTYTGSATSSAGAPVNLEARFIGTFQGMALDLATFGSNDSIPVENDVVQLRGFSTDIDDDNDDIENYLELVMGTDPFNPPAQCTPVTETVFATLTDDAFIQNSEIRNNNSLRVDSDRRFTLLRFSYDGDSAQVTDAILNLTVESDPGNGLLTVSAVSDFQWNDEDGGTLLVPAGNPVGSAVNVWEVNTSYAFLLAPALLTNDVTLVVRQVNGNDVIFQSSATTAPPTLELTLERCE